MEFDASQANPYSVSVGTAMIDPRFNASTAKLIAFFSLVFVILLDAEEDVDPLFSLSRFCWCWWSAATPDVVDFTRRMCARFRFERWLFLSAITHSFHARALGVDASMAVSFVAVGVRVSSRFFTRREGDSFVENKFSQSFGKKSRKRQNFKAREKEEDEEIQQR